MLVKRDPIDYSLDRRATLTALYQGNASAMDACDADPYLRRAAKHHGEITTRECPVCKKEVLRDLRYTFGDQLGQYSGRIKSIPELEEMQSEFGEFRVYTVEDFKGEMLNAYRMEAQQLSTENKLLEQEMERVKRENVMLQDELQKFKAPLAALGRSLRGG